MALKNRTTFWPKLFGLFQAGSEKWAKNTILAKKVGHLAKTFYVFGQAKTQYFQGFAGFLAIWPFIFPTIMRKMLKILYKWKIKVGFWPAPNFRKNFGKRKLQGSTQLASSLSLRDVLY